LAGILIAEGGRLSFSDTPPENEAPIFVLPSGDGLEVPGRHPAVTSPASGYPRQPQKGVCGQIVSPCIDGKNMGVLTLFYKAARIQRPLRAPFGALRIPRGPCRLATGTRSALWSMPGKPTVDHCRPLRSSADD
jgi:hypothetical protein